MLEQIIKNYVHLHDDEVIVQIARRSILPYGWRFILSGLIILTAFFLMYYLINQGWLGLIGFVLVLILGLMIFLRTYLSYYLTFFVVTSHRLIDVDSQGFFNRQVTHILYPQIQNVRFDRRGMLKILTRLGDVSIDMLDKNKIQIKLTWIGSPEKIVSDILYQQNIYLKSQSETSDYNKVLLNKIKTKLGEEQFKKIIND